MTKSIKKLLVLLAAVTLLAGCKNADTAQETKEPVSTEAALEGATAAETAETAKTSAEAKTADAESAADAASVTNLPAETGSETAAASTSEAMTEAADETAFPAEVVTGDKAEAALSATAQTEEKQPVTILYTNDIHTYIHNTVKDKDGSTVPGLRLSNVTAYMEKLEAEGKNVLLVDSGDDIQGCVYGSYDKGETVLRMMKAAGYQAVAVGNHEFDYGVSRLMELTEKTEYPFLSCTFRDEDGNLMFDASKILESGGVRIGFVGVTTPMSTTTTTPVFFQDEDGNFIYSFDGAADPQELYASVQQAVDAIRDEVDYVIVLGHLGCGADETKEKVSSYDVIANTTGIDVLLDGHSHTTLEKDMVKNKEGREVLLSQTGSYLNALGQLEISPDGCLDCHLITQGLEEADPALAVAEEAFDAAILAKMGQKAATLGTSLYINDPENDKRRLVRARETSMADFAADSVYWFFNEEKEIPCDVVLLNGGSIRTGLNAGDVSALDIKNVWPFGNQVCMIRASGQQILDALEMGARVTGEWDNEWDCPAENGGFMQVAGLCYTIDASYPSSLVTDSNGMFEKIDGKYRVKDVKVYNRATQSYEPLDPEGSYTVGGMNYVLRNCGDGLKMLAEAPAVVDFVGTDDQALIGYFKSFAKEDGYPYVSTENSPLKSYTNYLADYENPSGSGRILIEHISDPQ